MRLFRKGSLIPKRKFMTARDMSTAKWATSIAHSRAKRDDKRLFGVYQIHCGCGAEGCWVTLPKVRE